MLKPALAGLAALAATVTLGACGASTVSADDVEKQITSKLQGSDGSTPDSAECPEELDAEVGATLTCSVTAGEEEFEVEVEVTKVEDGTANFDITVLE